MPVLATNLGKGMLGARQAAVPPAPPPPPPPGFTALGATSHEMTGATANFAFDTTGAAAGDWIVGFAVFAGGAPTLTMTGSAVEMTQLAVTGDGAYANVAYAKALDAADVANGHIDVAGSGDDFFVAVMVVHGATSIVQKDFQTALSSDADLAFTNWAPDSTPVGAINMFYDANFDNGVPTCSPGTWTLKLNDSLTGGYFNVYIQYNFTDFAQAVHTVAGLETSGAGAGYQFQVI